VKTISGDGCHMNEFKNESVYLIVTSPLYRQLKNYSAENNEKHEECFAAKEIVNSELIQENRLLAYPHLKNKTLINIQLITVLNFSIKTNFWR
jgi:hypothetical protein